LRFVILGLCPYLFNLINVENKCGLFLMRPEFGKKYAQISFASLANAATA